MRIPRLKVDGRPRAAIIDAEEHSARGDTVSLTVDGIGTLTNKVVEGVDPITLPAARPGRLRHRAAA
jgi:hypothetical protein